jgi:hypothetical protein
MSCGLRKVPGDSGPTRISRADAPYLILGVLLVALLFLPIALAGEMLYYMDFSTFFYPNRLLTSLAWRAGEVPLWNPYNACGVPFAAAWHAAVFYPPTLLYIVLPFKQGLLLFIAAHLLIGYLSVYCLAARWQLPRPAAAFLAVAFGFTGYAVSTIDSLNMLCSMVYAPFILGLWWQWLRTPQRRTLLLVAMAAALQILAGGPEAVLVTAIAGLLLTLGGLLEAPRRWLAILGGCLLLAIVTFALSAVQLLPFLDLLRSSERAGGLSESLAGTWSMAPHTALRLVLADFATFVDRDALRYDGVQYWLKSYYVGAGILLLALLAVARERRASVWALGGVALLGWLLAAGRFSPLWSITYQLPVFNGIRCPVKFIMLSVLALHLLAIPGLRIYLSDVGARRRMHAALGGLLILGLIGAGIARLGQDSAGAYLASLTGESWIVDEKASQLGVGLWRSLCSFAIECGILLGCGLVADSAIRGRLPERWLRPAMLGMLLVLSSLYLRNALEIIRTRVDNVPVVHSLPQGKTRVAVVEADIDAMLQHERIYDQVPGLFARFPAYNTNIIYGQHSVHGFFAILPESIQARQDAWLRSPQLLDFAAVTSVYAGRDPDALLRLERGAELARARLITAEGVSPVALHEEGINWATYRVNSPLPGELRTSDSYAPGWQVSIDGHPATLVDIGGFRTLKVPAGEHEIRFEYRPGVVWLGGLISVLGLVLVWQLSRVAKAPRDFRLKSVHRHPRAGVPTSVGSHGEL